MTTKSWHLNRRVLLKGGGVGLALPLLNGMTHAENAAGAELPKRMLVSYFAIAILTYMLAGLRQNTDNQVHNASGSVRVFMWSLIAAEIGGFCILFYGVIIALL